MIRAWTKASLARGRVALALSLITVGACDCGEDGLSALAPVIDATPNPIDFGQAFVGIGRTVFLDVQNLGTAQLEVTGLRLEDGTHPGVSVQSEAFSLSPGDKRQVRVQFIPTVEGPAYGKVLIDSNDPQTPVYEVPIQGQGARRDGPVIAVCTDGPSIEDSCADPLRIDFGVVPFGQTVEASIVIRSVGSAPLDVNSAPETGHPSITFAPETWSGTLAVDTEQRITVSFSPGVPEAVTAVYRVNSNDVEVPSIPVIVTGSGVAPTLCLDPPALDFGQVRLGAFAERTVTLESCGSVAFELTGTSIVMGPEYAVQMPPSLPMTLEPGATLDVTVRYTPVDPGRDDARLQLSSSGADVYVALTGEALSCNLSVAPARVAFNPVAAGQSATRPILVENSGSETCEVTSAVLGMGSSSDFSLVNLPSFPATVAPGQSITLDVQYQPSDAGNDLGNVIISGTDPGEPTHQVDLSGRRLGIGECALVITPDPINFGGVTAGSSQALQVNLQNVGNSRCTVSQVSLASSSSRAFRISQVQVPMLIAAGATRQVELTFSPTDAQPHTGELEVYTGLIPLSPDFMVPISGFGAGPMLCPMPSPVVFGTHPAPLVTTRQVQLVSCGTQDVSISSLSLPAPTSSEFAMSSPPATPVTVPAGSQINLTLTYQGADEGRDDGVLRIQSNDVQAPSRDVPLIAHTSPGACGDIQGKLCDLAGTGPVEGANVYVQTANGRISTTTDANGDWVLTCVPEGSQTVIAEFGSWSLTLVASVSANQVFAFPGQQCLEPDSAEVAVVYGEWDQIETILDDIGVPYTFYDMGQASQLVNNPSTLAQYDIVFFNCGWEEGLGISNPGRNNIANFVMNGGTVYASDWAYDLIEVSWPSFVDFYGDDAVIDAAQSAGQFNGPAFVRDFGLANALQGRTQVTIDSCCTAVEAAGMGTSVYLEADRLGNGTQHPLMVSFQPHMNSGKVWYTDFHNTGQLDIQDIFSWLILNL